MKRYFIYFLFNLSIIFNQINAATFTVTTTADANVAPAGSLRAAINGVNAAGVGPHAINFNIPPNDGLVKTIFLVSNLPSIARTCVVDGYTQPQATPNTLPDGDNAKILIEIRGGGSANTANTRGLRLTSAAPNSTIRGLAINNCLGNGFVAAPAISVQGTGNHIVGNFLGTTPDGLQVFPNQYGLFVSAGSNVIGTPNLADRNIIAGSCMNGLGIFLSAGTNTIIQNNFIGVDASGRAPLDNQFGIGLQFSGFHTIGGLGAFERNIVRADAACIADAVNPIGHNIIRGNYIGVDVTGKNALSAATGEGIYIALNAHNDIIDSNVIAGCTNGIVLGIDTGDSETPFTDVVFNNSIINNIIGLDSSGLIPIPNQRSGIQITVAQNNIIEDNTISSNEFNGVYVCERSDSNTILNNYIGTEISGNLPRGNTQNGIQLGTLGSDVTVNDLNTSVQNNLISSNQANGILIQSGSNFNEIHGNKIGVNWNAQTKLGNAQSGVAILCADENEL